MGRSRSVTKTAETSAVVSRTDSTAAQIPVFSARRCGTGFAPPPKHKENAVRPAGPVLSSLLVATAVVLFSKLDSASPVHAPGPGTGAWNVHLRALVARGEISLRRARVAGDVPRRARKLAVGRHAGGGGRLLRIGQAAGRQQASAARARNLIPGGALPRPGAAVARRRAAHRRGLRAARGP